MAIRLGRQELLDRLHGAWVGALAGHGVGAPHVGEHGPLDVSGPPSADVPPPPSASLALQLLSLETLTRVGPRLRSEELASAWLERVALAEDEHGAAVRNLRRGLRPPVTGWFDNWFLDCSGAFERAAVWACVAPSAPGLAALLAVRDATIDHAEEGVHAAAFAAAVLSAAFVEPEPLRQLDAGLAMLPAGCRVARAAGSVRQARRTGLSWIECRERILEQFGHPNHTQAAQVVGLSVLAALYATDFETAVRRAASCGGATTATASFVGALFGIRAGAGGLPDPWATAADPNLALHNGVSLEERPASTEVVATKMLAAADLVLPCWLPSVSIHDGATDLAEHDPLDLLDSAAVADELDADPREVVCAGVDVVLRLDYLGAPTVASRGSKTLLVSGERVGDPNARGTVRLLSDSGLAIGPSKGQATPGAYFLVSARGRRVPDAVRVAVSAEYEDGAVATAEFPLLPESCWWICGPFEGCEPADLRKRKGPEDSLSESTWYSGRDDARVRFRAVSFPESHMHVEDAFEARPGTLYLVSDWLCDERTQVAITVGCSCGIRAWLNGSGILRKEEEEHPLSMRRCVTAAVRLRPGANRVMLKLVRYENPVELSFAVSGRDGRPLSGVRAGDWRPLEEAT